MTGIALPTNQDLAPDRLRSVFGAHPSGVVAVAARVDGQLIGLAASSFTAVSLNPPLVCFSIATTSKTWPILRQAERLGLTVLAEHHDALARQLAGPVKTRFDRACVTVSEQHAAAIVDGLANFDTSIYREVEAGDHIIVLLQVHAARHTDASSPLVFHRSGFTRLEHRPGLDTVTT